jgi:hypothetical protein
MLILRWNRAISCDVSTLLRKCQPTGSPWPASGIAATEDSTVPLNEAQSLHLDDAVHIFIFR